MAKCQMSSGPYGPIFFHGGVFFSGSVFSAFFSSKCVFFIMMGLIIVYTATYQNFLTGPNYFASLHSAY